jgi:hypothetical protein
MFRGGVPDKKMGCPQEGRRTPQKTGFYGELIYN